MLNSLHLTDLVKSGLSTAMIEAMGATSLGGMELANAIQGFGKTGEAYKADGYSIPYKDSKGNTVFTRYKLFWTDSDTVDLPKYLSPANAVNHLYMPPGFEELAENVEYILITEGEKKAAKAVQEGFPCVAIAGVWNWLDSKARQQEKLDGRNVSYRSKVLEALAKLGKTHKLILVFDSDLKTNKQVRAALTTFKEALRFQCAKWVRRMDMPVPGDMRDSKVGLDDLLCHSDGLSLLQASIDRTLDLNTENLEPLIRFAYDEYEGTKLYYTVPNTPYQQEFGIHAVYRDKAAEGTDGGSATITTEKIASTRVWLNRLVKSADGDNKTLYELGFVPLDGREPQFISGNSDLIRLNKAGGDDTLAEYGARVLGKERNALEEFFNQCQTYGVRAGQVGVVNGTRRRGWQTFQDAGQLYVMASKVIQAEQVYSADNPDIPVLPVDIASDVMVKDALVCKGDYEVWRATMLKYIVPAPLPALMLAASVAGVLRHWCPDSENFIVHLYGESSHGKTTALKAGASIWGNPDKMLDNWRTTDNGLERRCAARNDMTIFLDESGQAANEDIVKNAVYMIGNGGEKMRATKDAGDRMTRKFAVIALSTGEKQLIRDAKFAGQEVRTLEINASAIDDKLWPTIKGGAEAEMVNATLLNNYGWGIEPLIAAIASDAKKDPLKYHNTHVALTKMLRSCLSEETPAHISRRVKHYGLLLLAYGLFLEHSLGLPMETVKQKVSELLQIIAKNLLEVATDQFKGGEKVGILQHFVSQLASNQQRFWTEQQVPNGMVWGLIKEGKVYCIPGPLSEMIRPFDTGRLIHAAEESGVLVFNKENKKGSRRLTTRIGTTRPDCYVFDLDKINLLLESNS